MKVSSLAEWRAARRVRRVCAGCTKESKSSWWNAGRASPTRTGGWHNTNDETKKINKRIKHQTIHRVALPLLAAALLSSCSTPSQPPPPVGSSRVTYTKGVPGGVIVQTVKITATVAAIDQAKREATLLEPDGKKFTVKVGPGAVNFDQVRVGDRVTATVTERLVASLEEEGATSVDGTAAVVARAPKGSEPGGLAAATTQRTATVTALDLGKRTVTLRFDDGQTATLPVRDDVDLSRRQVGDRMVFRVTEMIAIRVEKSQ